MIADFSKTYTIEPKLTKGDLQGLDKEGISKHLGTSLLLFAKFDRVTNKFITGLDINAKSVLSLPKTEREKKQAEITELKEELEAYLGKPGILDAAPKLNNDGEPVACFWDEFGIPIVTGKNKQVYIDSEGKVTELRPQENPMHKLYLVMLLANDYLPMSKAEAANPKYRNSKFMLTTQDEVDKESQKVIRKEIQRGTELGKLFGDNPNRDRAWEIAYYMGLKPDVGTSITKLEADLYMVTKEPVFLDTFLKACSLDNEDILIANMFKMGVSLDLVRYDGGIKLYTFGATNLRGTEDESIEYLKTPGMSTALAQLREAVNKRKNKIKKSI